LYHSQYDPDKKEIPIRGIVLQPKFLVVNIAL